MRPAEVSHGKEGRVPRQDLHRIAEQVQVSWIGDNRRRVHIDNRGALELSICHANINVAGQPSTELLSTPEKTAALAVNAIVGTADFKLCMLLAACCMQPPYLDLRR